MFDANGKQIISKLYLSIHIVEIMRYLNAVVYIIKSVKPGQTGKSLNSPSTESDFPGSDQRIFAHCLQYERVLIVTRTNRNACSRD